MPNAISFTGGPKKILADLLGTNVTVKGPDGKVVVTMGDGLKKLAHKSHEYMPAVRAALKLSDVHGAAECADQLGRVRDMAERCSDAGGDLDGSFEGTDLGSYTRPLKALVDASPGDTWEEVFDAVEALIQAALEESEAPSGAEMSDSTPSALSAPVGTTHSAGSGPAPTTHANGDDTMADNSKQLTDLETKLADQQKKADDQAKLMSDKLAEFSLQLTAVNGKVAEQASVITAKDAEIAMLSADLKKRDAQRASDRVEEAFETYKGKMNLTDAHRDQMGVFLSANPDGFEKLYPRVPASQRHLLTDQTGPGARRGGTPPAPPVEGPESELSMSELASIIAAKKGIELADAQAIVFAQATKIATA